MKTILLTFLFTSIFFCLPSQNLITNPGFETASACPTTISQISFAPPWNNGTNTDYGTPDFYTNGGTCNFLPPDNGQGAGTANSGNGLSGLFCYRTIALNREYLVAPLSTALTPGINYTLSFYVRKSSQSRYSIDEIGAYFSTAAPPCTDVAAPCSAASPLMSVTPQLKTASGVFPDNTWQQYTFTITAAAAWQYVTIGNFDTDASTGTFNFGAGSNYAYLLFDDFSLTTTSILGIEVSNFKAHCNEDQMEINWELSSGIISNLTLETAIDGINFSELFQITAGTNNYHYIDATLHSDKNPMIYYRLKQTDPNGIISFSHIINSNNCHIPIELVLYPNPAEKDFKLLNGEKGMEIRLSDVTGQIIKTQILSGNNDSMDISDLADSFYCVAVYSNSQLMLCKKLIKNKNIFIDN